MLLGFLEDMPGRSWQDTNSAWIASPLRVDSKSYGEQRLQLLEVPRERSSKRRYHAERSAERTNKRSFRATAVHACERT
jgi:hypothetical protein